MGGFAALVTAVGIIGVIWGLLQRHKAGRLASAPFVKTGEAATRGAAAAGPKGAISVEGEVACGSLVKSPVTGTECLYYEYAVKASWKDGEESKSRELAKEKVAADFTVNDGSGGVTIDAKSGGDFDLKTTYDERKKTGLAGALSRELTFGGLRVSTDKVPLGAEFVVTEKVLQSAPRLYVCGKIGDGGVIGSPSWTSLILSAKSRDELLGHTTAAARKWIRGGAVGSAVGVVLGVVSMLTGGAPEATKGSEAPAAAVAPAGKSGAVAGSSAAAIKGSCDKHKVLSTCTDYREPAYVLGEESIKSLCEAADGKYSTAPCATDKQVGQCEIDAGQLVHYYADGALSYKADAARKDCTDVSSGRFTTN